MWHRQLNLVVITEIGIVSERLKKENIEKSESVQDRKKEDAMMMNHRATNTDGKDKFITIIEILILFVCPDLTAASDTPASRSITIEIVHVRARKTDAENMMTTQEAPAVTNTEFATASSHQITTNQEDQESKHLTFHLINLFLPIIEQ